MLFTDLSISALLPKSKRYLIRESNSPGFAVKVTPTGVKSFLYIFKQNGKQHEHALGIWPVTSVTDARITYELLRADAQQSSVDNGSNLPTLLDAYREFEQARLREGTARGTLKNYARSIYELAEDWDNPNIDAITSAQLKEEIEKLHASFTVKGNRTLAAMSSLYTFLCYKYPELNNPCTNIRRKKESPKQRKLSPAEIRLLLPALDSSEANLANKNALKVALLTAQRPNEVCGMDAQELDLKKGQWVIPVERAKNGREHLVPLSAQAIAILLETLQGRRSGPVFLNEKNQPLTVWSPRQTLMRLMESLGLSPASTHDLRRTAGHHLSALGYSIELISRILNHSTSGVTASVYVQYGLYDREVEKREALQSWADYLDSLHQNTPQVVKGPLLDTPHHLRNKEGFT